MKGDDLNKISMSSLIFFLVGGIELAGWVGARGVRGVRGYKEYFQNIVCMIKVNIASQRTNDDLVFYIISTLKSY